jgi:hypothetical protein
MKDGDQIDTVSVEGSVRGSMVHRTESGRGYIYFVSQAKKLYKVELGAGGTFGQTKSVSLSGASVGVPQITGDRAYVGTSAGKVDVIDIDAGGSKGKMSLKYSVSVQGYPQGELLVCSKDSKTDYIYGTYNKKPGGIFFIEAGENKAVASGALYDPLHPEYCISPVECDEDGNLYFKNDSGYIMAITTGYDLSAPVLRKDKADASATKLSWSVKGGAMQFEVFRSAKDGAYTKIGTVTSAAYSDSKTLPGVAYKYKVRGKTGTAYTEFSNVVGAESTLGKPKITTQAGKKKMTVRWKKVTGASGYKIYQATKKKGKFKCVKTIKGQTLKYSKKKLKSKKKYYFRVRAFRTIDGKIAYSAFSNISYKRVK